MTLLGKNNLVAMLYLWISISLGLCSCLSDHSAKQQKTTTPPSGETLPDVLDTKAAEELIKHYKDSKGENVDDNFFFDGKKEKADKVVSFRLNQKQAADFFADLDRLKIQYKDLVRIRIRMAFIGKNGHKMEKETNIAPLLELIVHDNNPTGNFYPLRPFKSDIIPLFKKLYGHHAPKSGDNQIPPSEARVLIEEWDRVPVDEVTKQLYQDQKTGVSGHLLQFYTFNVADTKAIYEYQTNLAGIKKTCYFYIHLGKFQEPEHVALRTIIHLDDNPIPKNKKDRAVTDDEPPYFEFAAQCPPMCQ